MIQNYSKPGTSKVTILNRTLQMFGGVPPTLIKIQHYIILYKLFTEGGGVYEALDCPFAYQIEDVYRSWTIHGSRAWLGAKTRSFNRFFSPF